MIVNGKQLRPLYKQTLMNQFIKEDNAYYQRERTKTERRKVKNILAYWRQILFTAIGSKLQNKPKEIDAIRALVFLSGEKARASSYEPEMAINCEMGEVYSRVKSGDLPTQIFKSIEGVTL